MKPDQRIQFKINKNGLRSIKNSYSYWSFFIVGVFLFILSFDGKSTFTINGIKQPPIYEDLINILSVLVFLSICTFLQRRKIDTMYYNYILTIDNNTVEKSTHGYQKNATMNISDIYEIRRSYNGGLFLYSNSKPKFIFIPYQIENRDELEGILKNLGAKFIAGPYNFHARYIKELFLLFSALLATDFAITNIYLIALISILLIAFLMAIFLLSLKNRRLSKSPINIPFSLMAFSFMAIILVRFLYIILQ